MLKIPWDILERNQRKALTSGNTQARQSTPGSFVQSLAWVEISKKSWVWFWRRRQGHGKRWGDSGAELYSELIF